MRALWVGLVFSLIANEAGAQVGGFGVFAPMETPAPGYLAGQNLSACNNLYTAPTNSRDGRRGADSGALPAQSGQNSPYSSTCPTPGTQRRN